MNYLSKKFLKHSKSALGLFVFICLASLSINAQQLSGKVVDENGEALVMHYIGLVAPDSPSFAS